jgi:hypothetical protein
MNEFNSFKICEFRMASSSSSAEPKNFCQKCKIELELKWVLNLIFIKKTFLSNVAEIQQKMAALNLQSNDEASPEIYRKIAVVQMELVAFNFQCKQYRPENENKLEEILRKLRAIISSEKRPRLYDGERPHLDLGNADQTHRLALALIDEIIEAEEWCTAYRLSYWQLRKELVEAFNLLKDSLLDSEFRGYDRSRLSKKDYCW